MSLLKPLMLYFCLALAISFWHPEAVFGNNNNLLSVMSFNSSQGINGTIDTLPRDISFTGQIASQVSTNNTDPSAGTWFDQIKQGISSVVQPFIDGLGNVINGIKVFFSFIFSPWHLLIDPAFTGMPAMIVFVLVLPLSFWLMIEIMYFIRGLYS